VLVHRSRVHPCDANVAGSAGSDCGEAVLHLASLQFGTITVGHSATKDVTLTNVGPTALDITSISITGQNSGDYTESNDCPLANRALRFLARPSRLEDVAQRAGIAKGTFCESLCRELLKGRSQDLFLAAEFQSMLVRIS
jgi:hypothetical protein